MGRVPWSRVVRASLIGTLVLVVGVLLDVQAKGGNLVGLIQPGQDGPSAAVFAEDFPEVRIPDGLGHDGQQLYAIARSPMHLEEVSEHLDRPRYRLQRPLFPALAWMLHPSGGGDGLVLALFVVGVVAVLGSGVAAGALSVTLGGGVWPAFLVPVLPGTYAALRMTLADTLALALVLASLVLAERRRLGGAVVTAAFGVLAKEALLVVLVGHALWRRTSASVAAAGSAATVTLTWWVALRSLVGAHERQVVEFTWPFGGIVGSADDWLTGKDWIAGVTVVGALALAALALWRRPGHPLVGALAAAAAFSVFLGPDVLGLDFNGPRTIGPVLVLAILTLGTPGRAPTDAEPTSPAVTSSTG